MCKLLPMWSLKILHRFSVVYTPWVMLKGLVDDWLVMCTCHNRCDRSTLDVGLAILIGSDLCGSPVPILSS